MTPRPHPLVAGMALLAALSAPASAQGTPPAGAAGQPAPAQAPAVVPDASMAPDAFLQAVVRADLLQLELGRRAAAQAQAETVREYGKRMMTNHNAIQAIVTRLAGKEGVRLPGSVDDGGAEDVRRIGALQGTEFDKAYVMYVAEVHPRVLAMYRWQCDNCADPEIKAFAMQTSPIIGTHARLADQLNQDVNKEELRLAAERRAEEQRAEEARKAQEAADAAAAAAGKKKPSAKKPPARK